MTVTVQHVKASPTSSRRLCYRCVGGVECTGSEGWLGAASVRWETVSLLLLSSSHFEADLETAAQSLRLTFTVRQSQTHSRLGQSRDRHTAVGRCVAASVSLLSIDPAQWRHWRELNLFIALAHFSAAHMNNCADISTCPAVMTLPSPSYMVGLSFLLCACAAVLFVPVHALVPPALLGVHSPSRLSPCPRILLSLLPTSSAPWSRGNRSGVWRM